MSCPENSQPSDVSLHNRRRDDTDVGNTEQAIGDLQKHLLPEQLPEIHGYEFAVYYRPCEVAGGDFYGFQPFSDGRMGFVVADVAGHGAIAAVMMAALRSALAAFRVFGRLRESAPQDVNSVIHELAVPGMFITAFFVSLDPPTGTIYCGNCGHPPAFIYRNDGTLETNHGAGDLPLGIVPQIAPPTLVLRLHLGDSLILYTDGITEARSEDGEQFGDYKLAQAITRASTLSAQGLCDAIVHQLQVHENASVPADDQCVLVCRRVKV